jgi:hypothetical protein
MNIQVAVIGGLLLTLLPVSETVAKSRSHQAKKIVRAQVSPTPRNQAEATGRETFGSSKWWDRNQGSGGGGGGAGGGGGGSM